MWVAFLLCALVHSGWASDLTFPPGLKFGAATASYQVEGAWNVSDKSESVWDRYTHTVEGAIADGATGDVACDSYHQWEKDIELAANMSLDFYRKVKNGPEGDRALIRSSSRQFNSHSTSEVAKLCGSGCLSQAPREISHI